LGIFLHGVNLLVVILLPPIRTLSLEPDPSKY